jgi:DNA-binding response OmpR family regulator
MVKVLVAEDDAFLSRAYIAKLEKEGFKAVLAVNGEEVMKKIKNEKPDIILLDVVMPKKNGFDVLYDLKQDANTKDVPVIILSNLGQKEDIKRGKDLGADDYLIKSDIAINDVINKIKQVLARTKKIK